MTDEYLLRSPVPTPAFFAALRKVLAGLPTPKVPDTPAAKACAVRGSLAVVEKALRRRLVEDYQANLSEAGRGYECEYVVVSEGFGRSAVGVLTRLFSQERLGNIYYGSVVAREASEQFSLWVDPE